MRLLIVRLSAMGDIIHSLPLAENARRAGAEVAWLAEETYAGLLEGNPNIDRLYLASTKRWRRRPLAPRSVADIRDLARALRGFEPDFSIDAQGLWKSALLAGLVKAPRVGFARGDRRESSSATLIDRPVRLTREAVHVVDQNLLLLEPVGIPVKIRAPNARYLLERGNPDADAFLRTVRAPFALYHPGSARAEKTWGEAQYADLARRLEADSGLMPVLSWGPGDESRVERLSALLPKAVPVPRLGLPALAHVIARSTVFVAGDTGPVHLADALGRPALALFGSRSGSRNVPERNRPYRGRALRLRDDTGVAEVAEEVRRMLRDAAVAPEKEDGNEKRHPAVTVEH
jgi:lipopolysaccharide heptosyltransferase I